MALTLVKRWIRKVPNDLLILAGVPDWKGYNWFLFSIYEETSYISVGAYTDYTIAKSYYSHKADEYTTIASVERLWENYYRLGRVLVKNKIIKGIKHGE